jgi:DNA topoisomerase III
VPEPPVIRRGASGSFYDKGLEGASHHAVIPNVNKIDNLREVWPRLSPDEKKLFDVIARAYLAALMPDFRYHSDNCLAGAYGADPSMRWRTRATKVFQSWPVTALQ